jgi:hypothetical protein
MLRPRFADRQGQSTVSRLEFGMGLLEPRMRRPAVAVLGLEVAVLHLDLFVLRPDLLVGRPEVIVFRPELIVGYPELLRLGPELLLDRLEVAMRRLEAIMQCSEAAMRRLEVAVLGLEVIMRRLELIVFRPESLRLGLEPSLFVAKGIPLATEEMGPSFATVAGRFQHAHLGRQPVVRGLEAPLLRGDPYKLGVEAVQQGHGCPTFLVAVGTIEEEFG